MQKNGKATKLLSELESVAMLATGKPTDSAKLRTMVESAE